MSLFAIKGSLELGLIYGFMALGVFLSFRTLNMPDLTVDSSFTLGASVSAMLCWTGHPVIGILLALLAGGSAGLITGLLHTKLKIQPLLSGILTMLGLYSVNLRVLGNRANLPLLNQTTVFHNKLTPVLGNYFALTLASLLIIMAIMLLLFFLKTRLGFVLRATGDNPQMVRAYGANTDKMILIGMVLSNSLVGFSGALIAQYQLFADISMGIGMVIIGLASVIIGEVVFGISSLWRRLLAVVTGSVLYRFILTIAINLGMPANDFKLVSAVIVTLALAAPAVTAHFYNYQTKKRHKKLTREDEHGADH